MRRFGLSLIAALALAAPAHAMSLPSGGKLSFDVVRKGKDIGDHVYQFKGTEANFTVKVVTDISVKVPLIRTTVYSFDHDSTEVWKGGKLRHLTSKTDDDGTPHQLDTGSNGLLPASLWNEDTVRSKKLLNTIDGQVMAVRVADLGNEKVETRSGAVTGHHYKISGGLERDLWYDDAGNLARVSFKADDGSTVTYVRK